jgi:hypothetical protein
MKKLLLLSTALSLTACAYTSSPNFGEAHNRMLNAQTENAHATDAAPEGSGAVGAAAQTRYKTGTTYDLLPSSTSSSNPSSGASH